MHERKPLPTMTSRRSGHVVSPRNTRDSTPRLEDSISIHDRYFGLIRLALFAGLIIKIGNMIFAYRPKDGIIDDGAQAVQTHYAGIYQRLNVFGYENGQQIAREPSWCFSDDSIDWRKGRVGTAIDALSEDDVNSAIINFSFALQQFREVDRRRLHLGLPLAEPPTTIIG